MDNIEIFAQNFSKRLFVVVNFMIINLLFCYESHSCKSLKYRLPVGGWSCQNSTCTWSYNPMYLSEIMIRRIEMLNNCQTQNYIYIIIRDIKYIFFEICIYHMDMFMVFIRTEVYPVELSWVFIGSYIFKKIAIIATSDIADTFFIECDSIFFTYLKNLSISEPSNDYIQF